MYYVVLDIRKVIYSFSQIYLSHLVNLQRSLNFAASVIVVAYLIISRPFTDKIIMISNIFVELMMTLIFFLVLGRGIFIWLDEDLYFDLGFVFILIGILLFQYIISIIIFLMKIKDIFNKRKG